MNKKILLVLILVILAGVGIGFSYYTFNKPISTKEVKDSVFSQYLNNQKEFFQETTDWYEVNINYPKNNQKIRDIVFEQWNGFAKENKLKEFKNFKEAKEELQLNAEGAKYAFAADYKMTNSTDTISYIYEIYTFTGGAHGGTDIFPITLNQKLEQLTVEEILPDRSLEKVSKICFEEILKQKKERLKEYVKDEKELNEILADTSWIKEGTEPKRDNYSRVWIDGDNIVISFGQYQVASYAEGIFEVKVPRNAL